MVRRMNVGAGEIIVVGFVLVVVFSASRMGQLGNALGKFVYSFKKASRGDDFVDVGGSRRQVPPSEDADVLPDDKQRR
jgi:sec-independent protein translocase protein TatA